MIADLILPLIFLVPLLVIAWVSVEILAPAKVRVPFGIIVLLAVGGVCYFIGGLGPAQELLLLQHDNAARKVIESQAVETNRVLHTP